MAYITGSKNMRTKVNEKRNDWCQTEYILVQALSRWNNDFVLDRRSTSREDSDYGIDFFMKNHDTDNIDSFDGKGESSFNKKRKDLKDQMILLEDVAVKRRNDRKEGWTTEDYILGNTPIRKGSIHKDAKWIMHDNNTHACILLGSMLKDFFEENIDRENLTLRNIDYTKPHTEYINQYRGRIETGYDDFSKEILNNPVAIEKLGGSHEYGVGANGQVIERGDRIAYTTTGCLSKFNKENGYKGYFRIPILKRDFWLKKYEEEILNPKSVWYIDFDKKIHSLPKDKKYLLKQKETDFKYEDAFL
jgi:hypothetical protein